MNSTIRGEIEPTSAVARPLPHVESLPGGVRRPGGHERPDALSGFIAASTAWNDAKVRLSRRTTVALWCLIAVSSVVCVGLLTLIQHSGVCRGLVCSAATLGGHPTLTLAITASSTAVLLATAVFTRGLTRAGERQLWIVATAAGVTATSVVGAVVVIGIAVVAVATFVLLLLSLADRG
jgi:hypothetical protein